MLSPSTKLLVLVSLILVLNLEHVHSRFGGGFRGGGFGRGSSGGHHRASTGGGHLGGARLPPQPSYNPNFPTGRAPPPYNPNFPAAGTIGWRNPNFPSAGTIGWRNPNAPVGIPPPAYTPPRNVPSSGGPPPFQPGYPFGSGFPQPPPYSPPRSNPTSGGIVNQHISSLPTGGGGGSIARPSIPSSGSVVGVQPANPARGISPVLSHGGALGAGYLLGRASNSDHNHNHFYYNDNNPQTTTTTTTTPSPLNNVKMRPPTTTTPAAPTSSKSFKEQNLEELAKSDAMVERLYMKFRPRFLQWYQGSENSTDPSTLEHRAFIEKREELLETLAADNKTVSLLG